MTRTKYKRLFIVLLAPLLVAGGLLAIYANKENRLVSMRCEPSGFGTEFCRRTGWGELDKRIEKDSPAWFDVHARSYEDNSFPNVYVSASQRQIDDVQILEVSPYAGGDDSPASSLAQLRVLEGQKISIIFGSPDNSYRLFNPLGCNELNFEESPSDVFVAGLCGIPNEVVRVKFRVGSRGQDQLLALKREIDEETSNIREMMIITYLTITPIFVLLFLILSSLVWTVRRATAYVAAG